MLHLENFAHNLTFAPYSRFKNPPRSLHTQPAFEFTHDYRTTISQSPYIQTIDPKATIIVANQYNQEPQLPVSGSVNSSSIPKTTFNDNGYGSTFTLATISSGTTGSITRNNDNNRASNTRTPKNLPNNNISTVIHKNSVHDVGDGNRRSVFIDNQKRAREREDERNGDGMLHHTNNMDEIR